MTRISEQAERSRWPAGRLGDPRPTHQGPALQVEEPRRRQMRRGCRGLLVHSPVFGAVVELGAGGLRLESPSPLAAGSRYVFRLNYGTHYLHLPGRVAWSRPHRVEVTPYGGHVIYQAGIELGPGQPDRAWRAALADRARLTVEA